MSKEVYVKPSDMVFASSLLRMLSDSVDRMKEAMKDDTLSDVQKAALGGAVDGLSDLHNMILEQIKNAREKERLEVGADEDDSEDRGGRFDA